MSVLAAGTTLGELQGAAGIEAALPEQTPVGLTLRFGVRPPGFDAAASALTTVLQRAGVQGATVTADPFSPTINVAWTKASVGLPTIIAVLVGGAALVALVSSLELDSFVVAAILILAAIALVAWTLTRAGAAVGAWLTAARPYLVIGGIAAVTVYTVGEIGGWWPYSWSIWQHVQNGWQGAHERGGGGRGRPGGG